MSKTTKRFIHPLILEEALKEFADSIEHRLLPQVGKPNKMRKLGVGLVHAALIDYVKLLKGRGDFTTSNEHECKKRATVSFRRRIYFRPMSSTVYSLGSEFATLIEKKAKERKTTPSRIFTGAVMTGLSHQKGSNDIFCDRCSRSIFGNVYLYSIIGYKIVDEKGTDVFLRKNLFNLSSGKIDREILQNDAKAYFIWPDGSNGEVRHQYGNGKIFSEKALAYDVENSDLAESLARAISKTEPSIKAIEALELNYKVAEVLGKGLIKLEDGRYIATFNKPFSMI